MIHACWRSAAVAALCIVSLQAGASESADATSKKAPPKTDPLLEPFLHYPAFSSLTLSPDGKHLAGIGYNAVGSNTGVVMIDTDTLDANLVVAPREWKVDGYLPYIRNPRAVHWLGDKSFAVNFTIADAAAFDIDGKSGRDLMEGYVSPMRDGNGNFNDWHLLQRDYKTHELSLINVATGENFSYDLDLPGKLDDWRTDRLGEVRVARTIDTAFWSDHTRITTWYRTHRGAPWQKVDERAITDDPFVPLYVPNRPDRIVVQARNGSDRLAIWDYDVVKHAFVELLAGHESEDISWLDAGDDSDEFENIVTDGLKRHIYWFDERFARLQKSVDAGVPDHVNLLTRSASNHVVVYSYSDVDPGRWYLLDSDTMQMKEIVARLPSIDPTHMQPMQTLHYPAADGLSIPAYLTLPGKPTQPAPTIVLIHGGPQARDRWQFDQEVQIFAAHGYAVFQPQFRGSVGFGRHFEEAGYGQWGQAMQDDITAGVHYLIDHKIADPARICIVGASYGGYAALWGLEKTPELYKCGVSVAGVSDLERMFHDNSDTSKSAIQREFQRSRIGDPSQMKATWDSVSPLKHADRIVAPTLIVHGKLDQRVPISHGEQMRDAMQALHKDVEWIEFPNEYHGIGRPENERVYYDAVFKLLDRTIGKGTPPFPVHSVLTTGPAIKLAPAAPETAASAPVTAPGASGAAAR